MNTKPIDRGGPCVSGRTVLREVSRVMNRNAKDLADAILAAALQGDSTAMLAAVQLLSLVNDRDPRAQGVKASQAQVVTEI